MTNPLHATYYADSAIRRQVLIDENVAVARETYRIRFRCPEIAASVLPGQFLMLRLSDCDDPLIGRPLAVYDLVDTGSGTEDAIDLLYHVKGKFTTRLARELAGQGLDVWGPLGNGFPAQTCQRLLMVAGGVGQTPFLTLAKEHLGKQRYGLPQRTVNSVPQVTLCFGAQSAGFFAGLEDFEALGIDVRLATDDGTRGHHGLVTDLLEPLLAAAPQSTRVVCCGPVAMMKRVAEISADCHVPCQVSLETPMACGVGICFTCVAKIRGDGGDSDYQRTCVEGPVFDADRVVWDDC